MVKNKPSNAGDTGAIPGQGTETPHAGGNYACFPQPLSPHTTARGAPVREAARKRPPAAVRSPHSQNFLKKNNESNSVA